MRLDELELYVDMNGYDEVYVVIKTHPSITQNKYTREDRLKEWVIEGTYKMHEWPYELSRSARECRIEKIENDAPKNSFLRIIVRMEDEEKPTYLSDFLNLNPHSPVIILNGHNPDEKSVLFQGLEPTTDLVDKYGDCIVDEFKIEDREFEDEYGYGHTTRPTMIITVIRGGLNTHTEKKPDTHMEKNPDLLDLSTSLKVLPGKPEIALGLDEIDEPIETVTGEPVIMKSYGNQVVEDEFVQKLRACYFDNTQGPNDKVDNFSYIIL